MWPFEKVCIRKNLCCLETSKRKMKKAVGSCCAIAGKIRRAFGSALFLASLFASRQKMEKQLNRINVTTWGFEKVHYSSVRRRVRRGITRKQITVANNIIIKEQYGLLKKLMQTCKYC